MYNPHPVWLVVHQNPIIFHSRVVPRNFESFQESSPKFFSFIHMTLWAVERRKPEEMPFEPRCCKSANVRVLA